MWQECGTGHEDVLGWRVTNKGLNKRTKNQYQSKINGLAKCKDRLFIKIKKMTLFFEMS